MNQPVQPQPEPYVLESITPQADNCFEVCIRRTSDGARNCVVMCDEDFV